MKNTSQFGITIKKIPEKKKSKFQNTWVLNNRGGDKSSNGLTKGRRLKNMIQPGEKINSLREVIIYIIFYSSKFLELN